MPLPPSPSRSLASTSVLADLLSRAETDVNAVPGRPDSTDVGLGAAGL
ncbi:hypothetical protein TOK_1162 [Pseudonocardia sp. N23]|nr:hypothetical protein TOK_1162 [Pseudonocardia sp. N23]